MSNPKNIQPNTLVHIIRGNKSDTGYFLVQEVKDRPRPNWHRDPTGVDTYVYCYKVAHMDGRDCGGKTLREFSVEYCTPVDKAYIDKQYDDELQVIQEKRENLLAVLGDVSATNV